MEFNKWEAGMIWMGKWQSKEEGILGKKSNAGKGRNLIAKRTWLLSEPRELPVYSRHQ